MEGSKYHPSASIQVFLANEEATNLLGYRLAQGMLARDIILFSGPMGVGKTTFARTLIKTLTDVHDIASAAYPIVMPFSTNMGIPLWLCDFFRLKDIHELHEIGIYDMLSHKRAIIMIEWPDIILQFLPRERCLHLYFSYHEKVETGRKITFESSNLWPLDRIKKIIGSF